VNQAVNAFKRHLPDAAPVNLVTEKNTEGRVYVSTYPTMIGLIDEAKGDERRFGVGHFDLVIIDEAHRSVFMKYGAIFDYFDSLLVGLTATPKDEVGRSTYKLFELEDGVPTDVYSLKEAVSDGYLVEAKSVSVPLKLPTTGIVYDQLSDDEKEQFELTDWKERAEDILADRRVDAPAINQWLFNEDTVDKVLRHLMERGQKVDGGDTLGKTIVFAKNHDHATFIAERFNKNYPRYAGQFARVIDFQVEYAQSLIDDFSNPKKLPQIAISVDMLDTGIDVPEVANLVFFKQVRSKTKFWQMVGRGTRLCPDLFGPGLDKECFYIFDYCGNLEFFSQDLPETSGSSGASLSKRLFAARLGLIAELAQTKEGAKVVREHMAQYGEVPQSDEQLRESILKLLQSEVGSMNTDNFIVRAKRRLVEKYQNSEAWLELTDEDLGELEGEIAGLPTELPKETVEAKLFDLLIIRLQSALLTGAHFERLRAQLTDIVRSLEEASSIPAIKEQLPLIQDVQSDDWWNDVSVVMLEQVRLRLRKLVHLIEVRKGSPVYTDFGDELGDERVVDLPGFTQEVSFERFREKARVFLRAHQEREAIQKLRLNEPLTSRDLADLEQILRESGSGTDQTVSKAAEGGLGLFVRSLVGLDREAAKTAFNDFLTSESMSASQIEFVNLIIDYLTEHGIMEPRMLYESPFTDINALGPEGLFESRWVDRIFETLSAIRTRAIAA
jgi:type I restriction enzyme R subunit